MKQTTLRLESDGFKLIELYVEIELDDDQDGDELEGGESSYYTFVTRDGVKRANEKPPTYHTSFEKAIDHFSLLKGDNYENYKKVNF